LEIRFDKNFMKLAAIILAAGKSNRFKSNIPKQFHFYKKDIILNHSIKKFEKIKEIKEIYVALNNKYQKKYSSIIKKTKKIKFFNGGKYRCESAKKGIEKLYQNYTHVLIHDAARPNFSIKLTKKLIKELQKNKCVVPAISSSDTTVCEKNYVDRGKVKFLQTPQAFDLNKIYKFHKKNKNKNITDDSTLFFKNKENIKFINGEIENKKITFVKDIGSKDKYHGIGYDIHQMAEGNSLFIGGVKIPSKFGTVGHSDGDSLLHALIDSFLGAAKLKDIGTLFPNTNKYKNIRSTKLLYIVIKKLEKINLKVSSIDLNIILQSPNLKNYKEDIRLNISRLCKINKKFVNVKAKTADKIGIIGKSKALACEVISTLENI
tara:strand:+ start:1675 stop:2802 length:1128 start_codon:yes stop_codon:yes gene_type:complete